MDVQIQQTPNPNARKFVLPEPRFEQSMNFGSPEAAQAHPLAAQLFALEGVYNVLMARDFITINKRPEVPWEPLAEAARQRIVAFFTH
ncbi:NifU N-terminal domain-containing protein [Litorilinea aerophila]|jgi:hypothetical protein|uniref:Scaffolding protein n=1 Tax=Litorilinea aerophila TaxID=1204385 RepID=A0A540VDY7_9CHLR|nr:NifU N-terminal domain-containing protein [Litorilinea aerophila]MCC9077299.1 NifU N-terminal domain-containing protein [Litorilinea aerophila]OUC08185.1 hypothetical protein RY27_10490 [Litorilinea aerophila]GIV79455.1 MAG: hypothetical protein KatS3mg050_3849 [Litorilinea sp.]